MGNLSSDRGDTPGDRASAAWSGLDFDGGIFNLRSNESLRLRQDQIVLPVSSRYMGSVAIHLDPFGYRARSKTGKFDENVIVSRQWFFEELDGVHSRTRSRSSVPSEPLRKATSFPQSDVDTPPQQAEASPVHGPTQRSLHRPSRGPLAEVKTVADGRKPSMLQEEGVLADVPVEDRDRCHRTLARLEKKLWRHCGAVNKTPPWRQVGTVLP